MLETSASAVFVGRQPIYTADLEVFAFELLFRAGDGQNRAAIDDGDAATAELILNSFAEIGLDRIAGQRPAFVNVPRGFLLERHAYSLPKDRVVLEILEDVEPDPEVLEAMSELRQEGYTIAMDDFVLRDELLPMVDLVDIVKVEFPALTQDELEDHVRILRDRDVRILAEKIETHEEFDRCLALEFDYYQGYFFAKPKVIQGHRIPVNKLALLQLISKLQSQSVRVEDIAAAVRTEPSLSYKLLRFVNSSYWALNTRVNSIQHAVTLAGIQRIKTFCSLSLLTKAVDHKPVQLILNALTRAKMCELLATKQGAEHLSEQVFMVGLFSAMDAVLDKPLQEVIELVRLSPELEGALLRHEGLMGKILQCVLEYEHANWEQVSCAQLKPDDIRNAYLDAIMWSAEAAQEALG